ncbi:unnamed protein product [Cyprideis torosa]|uniref:Uncharacterized protein n=1 Tax=Cyprideis torosa TaxID=163714 RepID=A0A7R8ZPF2_9CRUS|nr:unnamed protein product [Cyprideis torosa]CAG0898725.1 unnamed protein product [Cyprideis torosa]
MLDGSCRNLRKYNVPGRVQGVRNSLINKSGDCDVVSSDDTRGYFPANKMCEEYLPSNRTPHPMTLTERQTSQRTQLEQAARPQETPSSAPQGQIATPQQTFPTQPRATTALSSCEAFQQEPNMAVTTANGGVKQVSSSMAGLFPDVQGVRNALFNKSGDCDVVFSDDTRGYFPANEMLEEYFPFNPTAHITVLLACAISLFKMTLSLESKAHLDQIEIRINSLENRISKEMENFSKRIEATQLRLQFCCQYNTAVGKAHDAVLDQLWNVTRELTCKKLSTSRVEFSESDISLIEDNLEDPSQFGRSIKVPFCHLLERGRSIWMLDVWVL